MNLVTAFLAGLLFGGGLILSGMSNPAKVLALLDVTGAWDPSLLFVMLGAILVAALAFRFARTRVRPLFGSQIRVPGAGRIDAPLVLGSITFGVGWGLVGYCPGPALTALAVGGRSTLLFVAAMVAGMAIFEVAERIRAGIEAQRGGTRAAAGPSGE
ncbi:transporter [Massilia sp. Root133]|uniref:YeeE/YedE family protein n=1 Tax=Massilia cellulosiltytica TaxID=2683234 RepID=A0A7X3G615_9BURK|nr:MULTISPECIES: DUF6691 family protein [Telluria group]KQY00826.1 transporter [Massilia sp. Root133]KQZ53143.1 transporter [Massilia sp. Root1485]MVW63584.1 YeeE/YedE family protein [Telluria cellulosilytica]